MKSQNAKWVNALTDQSKDNGAFTAVEIDRAGFEVAEIVAVFQNVPANVAGLKITECDTSGGTFTDVDGTVVGTDDTIAGSASGLPAASGGDDKLTIFQLDLRKRKRFLKVAATAGDGSGTATELTVVARLSLGDVDPMTAAEMGAAQVLRV